MIRSVVLLLLGAHLVYAGTHTLKYFETAISGDIDFPKFTEVGLVDERQFMYFDSNIMKAVPKTEWIRQNEGEDYWDGHTQRLIGNHQSFKNEFQIVKERFNHSKGVHTFQWMYGCEWDDQTRAKYAFWQVGYDGEDFLYLDFKEMRYISSFQQGLPTVQKRNNERAKLELYKHFFNTECIELLQKYMDYGKSSLQKTVSPQVSLLQKDPSSPVTCHATGFYPSGVTITWMKNGQDHYEDVDLGELLPNEDGTFQKSSSIRVTPEEWKNNQFSCVVEHQGKSVTEDEIRTNNGDSVPFGIIVAAVAAVTLLLVIGVAGFMVYRKKQGHSCLPQKRNERQIVTKAPQPQTKDCEKAKFIKTLNDSDSSSSSLTGQDSTVRDKR